MILYLDIKRVKRVRSQDVLSWVIDTIAKRAMLIPRIALPVGSYFRCGVGKSSTDFTTALIYESVV